MIRKKKGVIFAVLAVIIIILAVILLGENEKTPLNNIEKLLNKKPTNAGKIVNDITPHFISKAYLDAILVIRGNDEYKDSMEEIYKNSEKKLENLWEEMDDELEDKLGNNVKFSYTIEDQDELEKEEIEFTTQIYEDISQYMDYLCDAIDILAETTELEEKEVKKLVKIIESLRDDLEEMEIKEGYKMEVEVVASGEDKDESKVYKVAVIKAYGEWFIDPVLTYVFNEGVDAEELEEYYDEDFKPVYNLAGKLIKNAVKDLEEDVEEMDEDALEKLFEMLSSELE